MPTLGPTGTLPVVVAKVLGTFAALHSLGQETHEVIEADRSH